MTQYKIICSGCAVDGRFDTMTEALCFAFRWLDGLYLWDIVPVQVN
jgi:hypothetical protein